MNFKLLCVTHSGERITLSCVEDSKFFDCLCDTILLMTNVREVLIFDTDDALVYQKNALECIQDIVQKMMKDLKGYA